MTDFMGLMKQAAELKSKMDAMQAELERLEVDGTAGGGLVTVRLSGKGELKSVKIDDSLIKPQEKEIVEDLIVAAHADARRKADALVQEKMKSVTGGLTLPPGLKLFSSIFRKSGIRFSVRKCDNAKMMDCLILDAPYRCRT